MEQLLAKKIKWLKVIGFVIALSMVIFSCSDLNKVEELLEKVSTIEKENDVISKDDVATDSTNNKRGFVENQGTNTETGKTTDVTKDKVNNNDTDNKYEGVSKDVLATFGHLSLSKKELLLVDQSLNDAIKNSKVLLLEEDPEKWFYYNQFKKDTINPRRKDMYEMIMKMLWL